MKKVMMSVALVSAIAAGYSMIGSDKSEENVADLTSANVEALAQVIEIGPICASVLPHDCPLPETNYLGHVIKIEHE